DRVALRVAELTREWPVLHVAVAAEHLDRLARRRQPFACSAHLGERHEDAPQQPPLRLVGRRARGRGALEREREAGLELHQEVDERLAYERVAVDPLAPLLAVRGVDRSFEERP